MMLMCHVSETSLAFQQWYTLLRQTEGIFKRATTTTDVQ